MMQTSVARFQLRGGKFKFKFDFKYYKMDAPIYYVIFKTSQLAEWDLFMNADSMLHHWHGGWCCGARAGWRYYA